jgi:hypothetical protein
MGSGSRTPSTDRWGKGKKTIRQGRIFDNLGKQEFVVFASSTDESNPCQLKGCGMAFDQHRCYPLDAFSRGKP